MTFARRTQAARRSWCCLLAVASTLSAGCESQRRADAEPLAQGRGPARPEPRPPFVPVEPPSDLDPEPADGGGGEASPGSPRPSHHQFGGGAFRPPSPARVRLAVIGDYGWAGPAEQQVAELVDSFHVDFVITTGDNNYPVGAASTIDENIGQYFSELIHPYHGSYASSATENRFFPVLGNHDWYTSNAEPYLAYFTLPGNERYYDIVRGDVHFFAIDSDGNEPDGITADSVQAQWLKRGLASSTAAFQLVGMHHPPYSSGPHGDSQVMQWPYAEWGADLVLAGHDHGYERIERDGITYVVSGLGGASIYSYGEPVPGSLVRYSTQYGATLIEADAVELRLSFFNVDGRLIDSTVIPRR
jgi:tartrate-resistant acid phosphatase type 5